MPRAEPEEFPLGTRRVAPRHADDRQEPPPARPALARDDVRADVRALRAEAAQAWSAALGDATSCALAKDGRSHPAGKFHEGRTAALGELLRACPADAAGVAGAAIPALAASLADDWASRRMPGGSPGSAAPDWEHYRAGGIDALRAVAAS